MSAAGVPAPVFDHLDRLSDERGLFEHALLSVPRREHGYCVDDVARGLVVVCREAKATATVRRLELCYLDFVLAAIEADGRCHNRMDADGHWTDDAGTGDWWGRAIWGLGVAAAHAHTDEMRAVALVGFRTAAGQRSPHTRSMAYAALGAAEVIEAGLGEPAALELLRDIVGRCGGTATDRDWPWPESRLSYANATVAQSLIVTGAALHDAPTLDRGLLLLGFLLRTETRDDHLSVTPAGGRGRGDVGPGYDQQPIEVAALAEACMSAYRASRNPTWLTGVRLAWNWFLGRNDSRTPMYDPKTGGGYDGLEVDGRNLNQGAESTLAMLSTAQQARALGQLR